MTTQPETQLLPHFRAGTGEPLVLLHGIGSQFGVWAPVIEALMAQRDVIAPNLPGFGEAPMMAAPARPDIAGFTDAVEAFMDRLEVENAHVAGNSLGGWIALELARRGRARSVTALSPAGMWSPAGALYVRASFHMSVVVLKLIDRWLEQIMARGAGRALLMGQVMAHPARLAPEIATLAARNLAASPGTLPALALTSRESFTSGAGIRVPVTVAWGARDLVLFPRQARRLLALVPQARLVPLPGCGHVPTFDDPQAVAQVLLAGSAGVKA
jgi:pimeloyl-ACP methyl ester carboxylesterase